MKAPNASRNATPRPMPTPSPILAPLDSPPDDFDEVPLPLLVSDAEDDVLDAVDEAVVEAGKSLSWKLSWNIGAYRIIVCVDVEDSTSVVAEFVSVVDKVITLGSVAAPTSTRLVPEQKAVWTVECETVAVHVFPFTLAHSNPLE
jgi:hypothetical protein